MLMRIAEHIDNSSSDLKKWFLSSHQEVLDMLREEEEREQERKEKDSNSSVLERSVLYETVKPVTACVVVCTYM